MVSKCSKEKSGGLRILSRSCSVYLIDIPVQSEPPVPGESEPVLKLCLNICSVEQLGSNAAIKLRLKWDLILDI